MGRGEQIRSWVNFVLTTRDWHAAEWARRAKVSSSTVSRARRGIFKSSMETLDRLEQAAGIPFIVGAGTAVEREVLAVLRSWSPEQQQDHAAKMLAPPPSERMEAFVQVIDIVETRMAYYGAERRVSLESVPPPEGDRRRPTNYLTRHL